MDASRLRIMHCFAVIASGLPIAFFTGCGAPPLPPMANADEARSALSTSLEAFKRGETSESLTKRSPAVYFNDDRWQANKLIAFTILDGHEVYGQSVRLTVNVTFKKPDGTQVERKVPYLVDTAPAIVIVPG